MLEQRWLVSLIQAKAQFRVSTGSLVGGRTVMTDAK